MLSKIKTVKGVAFTGSLKTAKKILIVDESINKLDNISDKPKIGDCIKKDMPLFTINIYSEQKDDLMSKIKNRIMSAMKIIDCYNTQLEYE